VEIAAIWERLKERGYQGSYMAVWRFVRRLEPHEPEVFVRVECKPGEEVQVDFGYGGKMLDEETGKMRRTWAFVMTLSWSRHQYVEFVWDQKVETWLRLHRNGFDFFGGVPQRVVIDNLKAGITKACWTDPQIQQSYRECAEHYGFLVLPCRPYRPQHKGKVEQGGVHYVKRNFLGGRQATALGQANRDVLRWCATTAGERIHGTTKEQPVRRFNEVEQASLQPLPAEPYDMAVWKVAKLHRDCYVVFDNSYYSAPFRLVNEQLRIRGGCSTVRIYSQEYRLVASHERATHPGERKTHAAHLPPEKLSGLYLDRTSCQAAANDIGPATAETVQQLLNESGIDRLPAARRLLSLRDRYGDMRLEAACVRALQFDEVAYKTVKRILRQNLDAQEAQPHAEAPPATTFVRSATELVGHLFGGRSPGGASWT
jgi:transposase